MSGIKVVENISCWKWSKKRKSFFAKNVCRIKDDRDSVTRLKNENWKKWKIRSKLRCASFFLVFKRFCAFLDNKSWLIRHLGHNMSCHTSRVMHACIICIAIHQVKCLMPNLFSKVKKYGWSMGSSNQCHREHPGRIRAWHPRDKGLTGQIEKFVWRPHQNRGSASSRPITLAKSTGPSTIRPNYEPFATWNWSPQPAATNAYSSTCFHGNISTCRSA